MVLAPYVQDQGPPIESANTEKLNQPRKSQNPTPETGSPIMSTRRTRNHETALVKRDALALRRKGHTYQGIADELSIARATAHRYVTEAIGDIPREEAAQLRQLEAFRLDQLQQAIWPSALAGDLAAVREAVRIIESRRKLFGLDAPAQVELGPPDVDIQGTAERILAELTEIGGE